jgi:hypothetical protein
MARLAIYLTAGMKATIKVPIDPFSNSGFFANSGSVNINGENKTLINGFVVVNDSVGKLEPIANQPSVVYIHQKPERNEIRFYARTGEVGFVDIVAVPIHDHSSIIQGGPAYGTYFNDDETV